jgi:hypothetical protein
LEKGEKNLMLRKILLLEFVLALIVCASSAYAQNWFGFHWRRCQTNDRNRPQPIWLSFFASSLRCLMRGKASISVTESWGCETDDAQQY